MAKNNNKQKPPNTLLSSQTTHPLARAPSPRQKPRTRSADDQEPTEVGLPSGSRRALRAGPVSQRRVNKLREGKLGVKWADRACLSARYLSCAPGCVGSFKRFNVGAGEFVPDPRSLLWSEANDSDKSANALDAGDIPLAAAEHQPAAVHEVGRLRHPLLAVDPLVVGVGAALADRPPRCALAG